MFSVGKRMPSVYQQILSVVMQMLSFLVQQNSLLAEMLPSTNRQTAFLAQIKALYAFLRK
jgi:hypothetical protein